MSERTFLHTLADHLVELAGQDNMPTISPECVSLLAAEVSLLLRERDALQVKLEEANNTITWLEQEVADAIMLARAIARPGRGEPS